MKRITPYVIQDPGSETWEENRAWQGCPTIARTKGGRLFAGWYTGGLYEPCIDNFNVLVKSDDDGASWSKPILKVTSDTVHCMRNIDIQLWVDEQNRLWVMWAQSPYREGDPKASIMDQKPLPYHQDFVGVEMLLCREPDAAELVFEKPRVVCFGFLRCKPLRLSSGRLIFPAYDWRNAQHYMLRISDDGGETFRDVEAAAKPDNRVFDETMVFELEDGKLGMMARTIRGYYAYSESADNGETWSETREFEPAPSSRFYMGKLHNGMLLYIRNLSDTERKGMKVSLSQDHGKTFPWNLVLDERENVSYPDAAESDDGSIFIVHDCERDNRYRLDPKTWHADAAKEILLSRVRVEDIQAGRIVSADTYLAHVISKARIDTVTG